MYTPLAVVCSGKRSVVWCHFRGNIGKGGGGGGGGGVSPPAAIAGLEHPIRCIGEELAAVEKCILDATKNEGIVWVVFRLRVVSFCNRKTTKMGLRWLTSYYTHMGTAHALHALQTREVVVVRWWWYSGAVVVM